MSAFTICGQVATRAEFDLVRHWMDQFGHHHLSTDLSIDATEINLTFRNHYRSEGSRRCVDASTYTNTAQRNLFLRVSTILATHGFASSMCGAAPTTPPHNIHSLDFIHPTVGIDRDGRVRAGIEAILADGLRVSAEARTGNRDAGVTQAELDAFLSAILLLGGDAGVTDHRELDPATGAPMHPPPASHPSDGGVPIRR